MLYKAMQVKEIPIIFRGEIANVPELVTYIEDVPEKQIDGETGDAYYEAEAMYAAKFMDNLTIWIDALDELFVDVPRRSYTYLGQTYYYFGSKESVDMDPKDYPFCLEFSQLPVDYTWNVFLTFNNIEQADWPEQVELTVFNRNPYEISVKKTFTAELTGNGQIKRFHARFACGENGTLHLNPYVILNGNITINLCDFAKGSDNYISGDNEEFTFDCYVPVETHALLCLDVENVGEYPSIVDAAIVVQYEDFIEEESIVGYEGINLGRKHR